MSNQNQRLPEFFTHHACAEFCDERHYIIARDKHNRQTYQLENVKGRTCCKIQVDGCLLSSSEEKKCDYLLLFAPDNLAFFIELKGQDLETGCQQIDASIGALLQRLQGFDIYARIVLNKVRTPALNSSSEIRLKKRLKGMNKQATRPQLKYQNTLLQERLE